MLLFLFFLVFLLDDVQLVISYYGIVLYCIRNCSYYLQVLFYYPGAGYCLSFRWSSYYLWDI
ncbi:hypothetical protein CHRY9293_01107 [Chryseobacterium potabilaquae]|uniref:Uncharacterized protein n=1 Tax=Chryseobacterium potabilaquae TaxID=2675057 RepID=A0A6N4X631_9FLAO|nr:hypothetical protein CHRY9293_01107 [Chryseobacterium potabilaquae]